MKYLNLNFKDENKHFLVSVTFNTHIMQYISVYWLVNVPAGSCITAYLMCSRASGLESAASWYCLNGYRGSSGAVRTAGTHRVHTDVVTLKSTP